MKPFKAMRKALVGLLLLVCLGNVYPPAVAGADFCAICGQPLQGTIYLITDEVTGEKEEVCSNCAFTLPRCYLCGLPIKEGEETKLPDGRYLCARDARTAVQDAGQIRSTCAEVKDDLDRAFSRFTTFPDNVDVTVIDRIDVDSMFVTMGHAFESPDLLGCIEPVMTNGVKRYEMSLVIGLPLSELKETCAHEYSHAWVGENVSPERHARISRDSEEGFCEMMGYLLMDNQGEEAEKKRVLENNYTRGQVKLFIAAEQQFGFDEVLDWMRYGVTGRLEEGHLGEIRDVQVTPANRPMSEAPAIPVAAAPRKSPDKGPSTIELEGIIWGKTPMAIINKHTFAPNDVNQIRLNGTNVTIRCEVIAPRSVRIRELGSGQSQELALPK